MAPLSSRTFWSLLSLLGVCSAPSTATAAGIVAINEVHYDQASGEQEFVELYATSGPVDLTGWTILDQDEMTYVLGRPANPTFPCTGTFSLNAGDRVVLWQGTGTSVCTGAVRQIFLNRGTFLQSAGDDLVLRDGTNACKDYVAFESGPSVNSLPPGCSWTGPNPSNGDRAGRSISRFDVPFTDTDRGVDWEASGATTTTGPKSAGASNVAIACTTNAACDDANPCTDDVCQSPATPQSTCVHNGNTASCSDGNPCTTPDACLNGVCVGGPNTCGSGGVFLNEVHYDQAVGEQEFVELFATNGPVNIAGWQLLDQDEMTYAFGTAPCSGAMILNSGDRVVLWQGNGTSVCSGPLRQIFLNRGTFLQSAGDDLVLRDGTNACKDYVAFESGASVNSVPAGCSWTGPNPSNGNTVGRSISRFDSPFTDTNRGLDWEASGATTTTGPKSAGVVNVAGPPIACTTNAGCDDNNPCTDDVCQNPGTPQAACVHNNNTVSCSDNNACTSPDTCANGACVSGPIVCACSTNADCSDGNPCTDDVCQQPATPQAVCAHTNNTAPCSDNNSCTGPDVCANGGCVSGPDTCSAATVHINEVHYDQASGQQEFIELYAPNAAVDITGWTIADQDEMVYILGTAGNPSFPCPIPFILSAGARLVLWQGSGTSVCTGPTRAIYMSRGTFLQSAGDDVVLRDGTNACKDYVAFESGASVNPVPAGCTWTGPNPGNGNIAGRSISRFDGVPFVNHHSGADWEASGATSTAGPSTPGQPNQPAAADSDGDGVLDLADNCRFVANPDQADADGDGAGTACDNCVGVPNPDQADSDGDTIGDACDSCPFGPAGDPDGDGLCGAADNCPLVSNPDQTDANHNNIGDACEGHVVADISIIGQDIRSDAPTTAQHAQQSANRVGRRGSVRYRTLGWFDASLIPAGSTILSVAVVYHTTSGDPANIDPNGDTPPSGGPITVALHEILKAWNYDEPQTYPPNLSDNEATVTPGQTTWRDTLNPAQWQSLGASGPTDAGPALATTTVTSALDTRFDFSSAAVVLAVQRWVNGTSQNHGFMLRAVDSDENAAIDNRKIFCGKGFPLETSTGLSQSVAISHRPFVRIEYQTP